MFVSFSAQHISLSFRGSRFDACLIPAFNPSLLLSDYLSFVLSFFFVQQYCSFLVSTVDPLGGMLMLIDYVCVRKDPTFCDSLSISGREFPSSRTIVCRDRTHASLTS